MTSEGWVFYRVDACVVSKRIPALDCTHEEADTRITWHLSYIMRTCAQDIFPNIVIRATDTDIMIILLYHVPNMVGCKVWMDSGMSSDNTRKYITISSIAKGLGVEICNALLAFHAFTGCDYTCAFSGKGKVRPFKLMHTNRS